MNLDPALIAMATAAVVPTKMLIDFMTVSTDRFEPYQKLLIGYTIALFLILLYHGYSGDLSTTPDLRRLIAGDMLAAFQTLFAAVGVTEVHKLAERKKAERKADQPQGDA